ncbi:hypothetical protein [Psychrobacter sp. APC 3350]|uniref:hypothetical protein n=1 Tax=Psychrobacter TaxID=497 RepID=UPI0025B4B44E|nr:hypothetical protein [Psychrobacter sp. APC 3350]MDN3454537.1 hypothetical protein [Psychrobacter sp. APC 3350]
MKTKLEYQLNITEINKGICEKYWLREKANKNSYVFTCKEIGEEYGFKYYEIPKIAKENAHILVLDCQCIDCGVAKNCKTRSELIHLDLDKWRCNKCLNELKEQQERLEQEQYQTVIKGLYRYRAEQEDAIPPFEELGLIDKLLLIAIVESLGCDNLRTTLSLVDNLQKPLSPLYTMDERILEHLFEANVLLLNPLESLDYVNISESGEISINLDYSQATFDFAYDAKDITNLRVKVKEQKTINDLFNNAAFRDWCENIQLAECLSYLIEMSRINSLSPPLGDKMMSLLQANLTTYSVAELYRMIWMAVESASSYSNKPNVTTKHASNSIYTILRGNIDKVDNGIWQCKPFSREVNLPKSAISKVFFDDIFKMYDCGFKYMLDALYDKYYESEGVRYTTLESTQGAIQAKS